MPRTFLLLICLCLLPPPLAEARTLVAACRDLVNGDKKLTRNCVNHGEFFELKAAYVRACLEFHREVDVRMRCLKSGADLEILEICRNSGWSLNSTLSCLRSYPTRELMRACKRLSEKEEEQLRCVRIGRESKQVEACLELLREPVSRLECLRMDIPVTEAKRCQARAKGAKTRIGCLERVVAEREGEYRRDQRELRMRMPASDDVPLSEEAEEEIRRR
jgi:hypothetical protein